MNTLTKTSYYVSFTQNQTKKYGKVVPFAHKAGRLWFKISQRQKIKTQKQVNRLIDKNHGGGNKDNQEKIK